MEENETWISCLQMMADSQVRLRQLVKKFWRVYEKRQLSKSKVMKCARMLDDRTMNVALNENLLEEVKCSEFLTSQIAIGEGTNEEVKFIMNKVVRMCGGMKKMFV